MIKHDIEMCGGFCCTRHAWASSELPGPVAADAAAARLTAAAGKPRVPGTPQADVRVLWRAASGLYQGSRVTEIVLGFGKYVRMRGVMEIIWVF